MFFFQAQPTTTAPASDRTKRTSDTREPPKPQPAQHNSREPQKAVMINFFFSPIDLFREFSWILKLPTTNLVHPLDLIGKPRRQALQMNRNSLQRSNISSPPPPPSFIFSSLSTCIFCSEKNEDFAHDGLETHYWANCPMLRRCQECNQVVEVGIYIEHLLRECAKKGKYQQCPRCSEPIGNDFDVHIKLKECIETKPNTVRCPLCHMNIREGEKPWREHLMGMNGCVKNPRRLQALKKSKRLPFVHLLILFF